MKEIAALKKAVLEKLDEFNHHPFQKREYSRYEVWAQEEAGYLRNLPDMPYEISSWVYGRKINLNSHIVYQKNYYSCPYRHVGRTADLKVTDSSLEIYVDGKRVSTHSRFPEYMKNKYSTHMEDMPDRFQQPEWDDVRITRWAYAIGANTGEVVDRIFASVKVKKQGYNPSLSVLRLSKTYSEARLETACEMALTHVRTPRYHHLKAILAANQDQTYLEQKKASEKKLPPAVMSVVRLIMGVEAMVNDETKRKLRELNLGEIISALELQQADVNTVTLSFDERLQRIVDYLYQEKYNNKIQRLIRLSKFRLPKAEVNEIYYQKRGIDRNTIQELSTCQFMHSNTDIIFQGFTGSGKTYLACAIGKQACKQQVRTHYIRLPDLLVEHDEAVMTQRSHHKLLKKYSSYKLLVIDEWLLNDISEDEQYFLFGLVERHHDSTSTIFCTQYRQADWHARLGGGIHADAILDRIVHNAVWVETGDMNMREYCAKNNL